MTNTAQSSVTQNFYAKVENVIATVNGDVIHNDYSRAELSPEVLKIVNNLQDIANKFPSTEKHDALVYLNDLRSDLSKPEPDKNQKTIATRIRSLLIVSALVGSGVAEATDFTNNVLQLNDRLGTSTKEK